MPHRCCTGSASLARALRSTISAPVILRLPICSAFPFDTIKIDKSFVHTTAKGTRPVILRSIIALAHDLGMDVVAEGAETDSDAVELSQLGCEYAQGFVFGEPMTPERARDLIQVAGQRRQSRRGTRVSADQPTNNSAKVPYACPASLDSIPRSMPIFFSARSYLPPISVPKISSESGAQCSQPLPWISLSSWPGAQPA